jgi:hypothetical protein
VSTDPPANYDLDPPGTVPRIREAARTDPARARARRIVDHLVRPLARATGGRHVATLDQSQAMPADVLGLPRTPVVGARLPGAVG